MAFTLPRLFTSFPIVDSEGRASPELVRFWNQLATNLENSINSIETLGFQHLTSLGGQNQDSNVIAALTQANLALTTADAGGSATARSGSTTLNSINVPSFPTMGHGPQVNLTSVSAGNLTMTLIIDGHSFVPNPITVTGHYSVVEIVSGIETDILDGLWELRPIVDPDGTNDWLLLSSDASVNFWSGVTFPATSTGNVSYRLDFGIDDPLTSYVLYSATLYVRRS